MSGSITLPILDMAQAKVDKEVAARKVIEALAGAGFAYIDNVEGLNYQGLLECSRWLFGKSPDFKRKIMRNTWNPENKNVFRGYFPAVPGDVSYMEGFEFTQDVLAPENNMASTNWFYEKSVWPEENGEISFKDILQSQYKVMHETCLEILSLCAIGLGMHEDSFTGLFGNKASSTFRIVHYPPRGDHKPPPEAYIEGGKLISLSEHTDSEIMTLVQTYHYRGLEVKQDDGTYGAVKPRPGSLIMNIGETLSRMLGRRLKATKHRVMDIGEDRYSVAFFMTPHYDADIGINSMDKNNEQDYEHVAEKFGHWYIRRLQKYVEFDGLPDPES